MTRSGGCRKQINNPAWLPRVKSANTTSQVSGFFNKKFHDLIKTSQTWGKAACTQWVLPTPRVTRAGEAIDALYWIIPSTHQQHIIHSWQSSSSTHFGAQQPPMYSLPVSSACCRKPSLWNFCRWKCRSEWSTPPKVRQIIYVTDSIISDRLSSGACVRQRTIVRSGSIHVTHSTPSSSALLMA